MEVLDRFMVQATISACGRAMQVSPWLARDAVARGHEISAHGCRWESHCGLTEEEERGRITKTVAASERATGQWPVG
jgi:peptidoglycan/xylan/chitin deacetylase (PgdA/CDA1 family)